MFTGTTLLYQRHLCALISKIYFKMSQIDEQPECPLCMEPLEVDDLNFFPCTCGYQVLFNFHSLSRNTLMVLLQICRFCWHRIRTDENGLCPACRKAYPENPADFKPLSQEQVSSIEMGTTGLSVIGFRS